MSVIPQLNEALNYVERAKKLIVDETRSMGDEALSDIITRFAEIRALQARFKAISSGINQLADHLSYEVVPLAMERDGFSTVNHESGRIDLRIRTTAALLDKDGAFEWLRANGKADLIIETVNAQTLGATAREMIEAGDELPSDLFKTNMKTYAALTKAGAKKDTSDEG